MNILILGANGMLGPLVTELLEPYHTLRLSDINELETDHDYIKVDISSLNQVVDAAKGMDAIINLSVLRYDINLAFDVNCQGTYNTLVAAAEHGIRRVINTGPHFAVAGKIYEDLDFMQSPDMPAQPGTNLYALTKSLGHELCKLFSNTHDMSVITLLFMVLANPGQIRKSLGSITYLVEWRDAARSIKAALDIDLNRLDSPCETFFILDDMPHGVYQNNKAKNILGWSPKHSMENNWHKSSIPYNLDNYPNPR